ncbi:DUF2334 domain-containing protein [Haloimpatiens massiliensis]|uniref:DUF2334 domain-containing protein n=1 Tax=Haloimpatiens massiliensis TaxID=1658110 RepID=UPI001FA84214|nr:polysaccharide deacetylase family protein [Haloimpatiens massiliensis]
MMWIRKNKKNPKGARVVLFALVFLGMFNSISLKVSSIEKRKKALVIYDRHNYFSYSDNVVNSIKELFGAYDLKGEDINVEKYKSGYLNNYDYVFVLGIDGELNNRELIKDLKEYKGKICWIGKGIEFFLENNSKYNLQYSGKKMDITEIYYSSSEEKNKSVKSMEKFIIESKELFTILKPINNQVQILSYISDGREFYPYALNSGNLWYVSRVDDNSVLFYIFSDLLNHMFSFKRDNKGKVYVRIEDVHPFRDQKQLRVIADYLNEEGVPFMIALIPTYVDTKTGYVNTISHKKDFSETIRYMQERGGSVILHGYTHQNSREEASGEGFEFWDGQKDQPLKGDMERYVYDKVGSGLKECVKNGIYPLGFEAPHYAMDIKGYKEIKKYFSTYVGQYQSNNQKFTTTSFPYKLYDTDAFNKLIPENLGYVDPENILSISNIKENFKQVALSKGYIVGAFFHCYLDIGYLKEIVQFFKSQNVDFLDLKKEDNWVKWNDISIKSKAGRIEVSYPKEKYNNAKVEKPKKVGYIGNVNLVFIVIVSIFCIIFLIIFIVLKKIDRKKFLR